MNYQNTFKFIAEMGKCSRLLVDVEIALIHGDKDLAFKTLKLLASKQTAVMEQVVQAQINSDHELDFSEVDE